MLEFAPLGESALIVRVQSEEEVLGTLVAWKRALEARDGIEECLPAYSSLTIFFRPELWTASQIEQEVRGLPWSTEEVSGELHDIPVCYDGACAPDMEAYAETVGMTPEEVVEMHTQAEYTVAGIGFSPGFAFLSGLPEELACPRRAEPRMVVPSGSVGVANVQTGVYPSETAGGWNLIGRTNVPLVDYEADLPSRLQVGDRVRFVSRPELELSSTLSKMDKVDEATEGVEIVAPGFYSTIQDLGRRRGRDQGLPVGGAMDRERVELLNALLDNESGAAVIEFSQKGPVLRFDRDAVVAVGAACLPSVDGVRRAPWSLIQMRAGQTLDCGVMTSGVWGYVAIRHGWQVPPLYGSVSAHPHLGIGRILAEGGRLCYQSSTVTQDGFGIVQEDRERNMYQSVSVVAGAQWDWFSPEQQALFLNSTYEITRHSNRVGYRLQGAALETGARELTSEGASSGTIQITNGGQPIVLMADAQSIGGYPKIAHICERELGRFAQMPAGSRVRFALA